MFQNLQEQASYIEKNFKEIVVNNKISHDNLIIYVKASEILSFLKFLINFLKPSECQH